MQDLEEIKPTQKHLVFDLVEQCGLDMSGWIESSNDPRGYKANPSYCYEWSFAEPDSVVVLNLWHDAMEVENGSIVQRGNFRKNAKSHEGPNGKVQWRKRATKLDEALQLTIQNNLPVRVIINDGERRKQGGTTASKVLKRELDPEPWAIFEYDWSTGEHAIMRGIIDREFVDQFDIEQSKKAEAAKRDQSGSAYVRDPKVRNNVKRRSNGKCEFCGEAGFKMSNGALYLETHHIIPLAEGGPDTEANVIALCPLDHRKSHYSHDATTRRTTMTQIVATR